MCRPVAPLASIHGLSRSHCVPATGESHHHPLTQCHFGSPCTYQCTGSRLHLDTLSVRPPPRHNAVVVQICSRYVASSFLRPSSFPPVVSFC
ncbi:hypothetical protein SESBI_25784 [Sesbania bispinosa]|nr:hypothetical protein SESBI_25784 [Sesbania bispinosa]